MYILSKIKNPEVFQGANKRNKYFEGWYYMLANAGAEHVLAVIPGISLCGWDSHAFIQIISSEDKVYYYRYDIKDFAYNEKNFEFKIGENYFSKSRIRLNLIGNDFSLLGDLYFCNILEYPRSCLTPGVMGPFLYIPGMECYHDIITIRHNIIGHLEITGEAVDFTSGIGYIEKDWGKNMPRSWLWFTCNHFQPDDVSVSISIANVPFLWGSFTGFIALFRFKERIFMFTSYSGAKLAKLYYTGRNKIRISFKECRYRLDMLITYTGGGKLKAPVCGQMGRGITETLNSTVRLRFSDRSGRILYEGIGTNGGLEIVENK